MAKRLNGQYTQEQVEQVLGRTTRLYTVHLLGPEGDDDDSGKKFGNYFYLFKILNKYLQEPLILYGQKVGPSEKCTKKHSFRLTGSRCDVLLAAETSEQRQKWMSALNFAATGYKVSF